MFKGMWKMVFRNRPSLATNLTAIFQKSDHLFCHLQLFECLQILSQVQLLIFSLLHLLQNLEDRYLFGFFLPISLFIFHPGTRQKTLYFKQKRRNLLDTILWTSISVVKVFPLSTWKTSIGHSLWTDCPITGHFQDWSKKVETLQYYSICVIDVFDV